MTYLFRALAACRSRIILPAALLLAVSAGQAGADPLKACIFSFHGAEEIAVFQSRLPAGDFEILDLRSQMRRDAGGIGTAADVASGATSEHGWLQEICRNDLECDITVFSAEFAGKFFGRLGRSLSLQEMEEASCQARCDGLFHTPREVFLLACNTLATKDFDMRGPAVYLQVLLDHGFDRASAERVVATRYGPLGPAFREAVRRIFMGVPRIYGFTSVAPLGEYSGPMLERYFDSVGNYRSHLERMQQDGPPNRAIAAAFAGTSLVETSGLVPSEPAAADRDQICALYDERRSVAHRLEIVANLMDRSDLLAFVPTVQTFINRHAFDAMGGEERRLFEEIQDNAGARERILALVYQLDVSALRLELGIFAVHLGWMPREEFRALVIDTVRHLLRRQLTSDMVDVMCEVPKYEVVGDQFDSEDLPEPLFRDAEGIRLISCLMPRGDKVSERLAGGLDAENLELRAWTAHALSRRLPLPDPVLLTVAAHLHDPSAEVSERLRWIFEAQRPLSSQVRSALAAQAPELAAALQPPPPPRRSWWE
jgi:hypothetical protein